MKVKNIQEIRVNINISVIFVFRYRCIVNMPCYESMTALLWERCLMDSSCLIYEPHHDKTNIVGLRPAWIQTSLSVRAVWSGNMLFAISFSTCNRWVSEQHGSWSDCTDTQAGLDSCLAQTHYVGFVMTRLILWYNCMVYYRHTITRNI
jgi:hypothetical protein